MTGSRCNSRGCDFSVDQVVYAVGLVLERVGRDVFELFAQKVDDVAAQEFLARSSGFPGQRVILLAHAREATEGHDRILGAAVALAEHDVVDSARDVRPRR